MFSLHFLIIDQAMDCRPMLLTTMCVMMMMSVASIYGNPIKRSATDQQATDCYGTECYYDPDYFTTDTVVNVNFPENLTDVVLNFIPDMMEKNEKQLQNMTSIMEDMALMMNTVIQLLQNQLTQLTVLNERLPVPPPTPSLTPEAVPPPSQLTPEVLSTPSSSSPTQHPYPEDCQDVAAVGPSYQSGVYTIAPQGGLDPFQVYCDLDTEGGGWTVFQQRFDGSVDFYLEWDDYVRGFGSADGEFWAGLRQIHQMNQTGVWQLRIDMEAFDGDTAYAMYDSFSVGDASAKYQLHIDAYHGTAGDSLAYHNGMPFSTKDRDNDAYSGNCAQHWKGAWWYNNCHDSNLNALYLGPTGSSATGNKWDHWKRNLPLKRTEMKMRHVD